jgi:hypothetical protein
MRSLIVVAALVAGTSALVNTSVFGQECLRPEWGKCVAFPNGGKHTGVSIQREKVETDVTPGPDICVSNEEEIGGYTFARFQRAGTPWPNADWGVNVDDFCFYPK